MATTFDALRPNDLIFNYVVSNWLLGQDPPAFDILAWNSDNTRMPATMHAFYLRSLYLRNELARGVLEVKGQRLSLADVRTTPTSSVPSTTTSCPGPRRTRRHGLMGGDVRYVLSSGGHIAGIVNPPGPKAWYEEAKTAVPGERGAMACGRGASQRVLVGGLGQVGGPAGRPSYRPPAHGQRDVTRRSPTRRAATSTAEAPAPGGPAP